MGSRVSDHSLDEMNRMSRYELLDLVKSHKSHPKTNKARDAYGGSEKGYHNEKFER